MERLRGGRILLVVALAALAGCDAQPMNVLNTTMDVDNTGWSEEYFSITADMNITFKMEVIQGNMVDVRLCPKNIPTTFKSHASGDQLRGHAASFLLEKGDYMIRAKESTPRSGTAVEKARITVSIKGTLSRSLRRK